MDLPAPGAAHGFAGSRTAIVLSLGRTFLLLGAMAFGGQGAAVAMMQRELVDKRGWLEKADILEALTYSVLLPGPTMFEVAVYLGYKLGGWTGAVTAAVTFLIPALLTIVGLAALYGAAAELPGLAPAIDGLTAATSGIILVTAVRLSKGTVTGPLTLSIAVAACIGGALLHLNTALMVIAAGLFGAVLLSPAAPAPEPGAEHRP